MLGKRKHVPFDDGRWHGLVVVGWVRGKDRDLGAPIQTWAGAEAFAELARKQGAPIAWVARADDPTRAEVTDGRLEKMAEKRVYVVAVNQQNGDAARGAPDTVVKRLVKAAQPAQAIRHVAKGMISAHVGKQDELIELAGKGVKVEEAGEDA